MLFIPKIVNLYIPRMGCRSTPPFLPDLRGSGYPVGNMMKEKNPHKYIIKSAYGFDVLPADDYLAFLSKFLYEDYKDGEVYAFLSDSLNLIKDQYDFILIDLPPNLGDHTVNALYAADYAIPIFHPEPP